MYRPYCVLSVYHLEPHFYHQTEEVHNKKDSVIVAHI